MQWLWPLLAILAFATAVARLEGPSIPLQGDRVQQSPRVEAEQNPESSIQHQQQSDSDIRPHFPTAGDAASHPEKPDTTTESNHSREEGSEFWPVVMGLRVKVTDSLLALFTFVLAVFTGGLWLSTHLLWKADRNRSVELQRSIKATEVGAEAAKRSAETAELALTKLQRAFVYNKDITSKPYFAYTDAARDQPIDRGWIFTVEWHNNGETQARDFLNHINYDTYLIFDGDLPEDFIFSDDRGAPSPGASYVPPKNSRFVPVSIQACIFEAVRARQIRLFLWGWTTYRDIFDASHQSRFCLEVDRIDGDPYDIRQMDDPPQTIGFNFRLCGRYNCVDEDCEHEDARDRASRPEGPLG